MGSTKFLLGGMLAMFLVGSAMAADDQKCEYGSQTGKQDCKVELLKDQALTVNCGSDQSTFVPSEAFSGVDKEICTKELTALDGTCTGNDLSKLNAVVPGASLTGTQATFTVKNTKELDADKSVYAICKNNDSTKGFVINVKFKKGGSNDASSRGTIPAIILGSFTTLVAFLRT